MGKGLRSGSVSLVSKAMNGPCFFPHKHITLLSYGRRSFSRGSLTVAVDFFSGLTLKELCHEIQPN